MARSSLRGSRTLVQALFEHGLVDEFRLMAVPGRARQRPAPVPRRRPGKMQLTLADSKVFDSGVATTSGRGRASTS